MTDPLPPLVSSEALMDAIDRPEVLPVDCRFDLEDPDWGHQVYLRSHIPGAIYAHLERDLSATPDGTNGRHPLPSVDVLEERLSSMGIDEGTSVVAYDSSGGPYAARLWWTLRYLGHEASAVLDGGYPAWTRARYRTESGEREVAPSHVRARPREEMLVTTHEVRTAIGAPDIRLLDARAPERYRGESEPYDPVAGRIPGAHNRFWKDNLKDDGTFQSPQALRRAFEATLDGPDPRVAISYCGSGVTAAHNLLAIAQAGLPMPRLYVGSWSAWCADPDLPRTTGRRT